MKRSEINQLVRDASDYWADNGWTLPPNPRWDVTDFGLGDWRKHGLVLVNLAEEKEYCEKLMYAKKGMVTPTHYHKQKKEDIICRTGELHLRLWKGDPEKTEGEMFELQVNNEPRQFKSGDTLVLKSGERVTLVQRVVHEFWPASEECVIGEVSTANDDAHDNYFFDENIGRFPGVDEDEPPVVKLLSDQ
jgi:hypothetical protein